MNNSITREAALRTKRTTIVDELSVREKYERRMACFVMLEIYLPAVKFCIVQSIPGLVSLNNIANYILGAFCLLLFLRILPYIIQKTSIKVFLGLLMVLALYLSTYLFKDVNVTNANSALYHICIISLPLFFTALTIRNHEFLYEILVRYAPVVLFFGAFMFLCTAIFGVVGTASTTCNMSLSYYCLVPAILCFSHGVERRRAMPFVWFGIGVFVIVSMGSRGTILCLALFIFLFIAKTIKISVRNIILLLFFASLFIFIWVNLQAILIRFSTLLEGIGIESRTIAKILNGTLLAPSDRDVIIRQIMGEIRENFWGIGFMGYLISHNILFENVLWFGVIPGIILDLLLFCCVIRTLLIRIKDFEKQSILILAFFAYSIPDALLNLTVWGKDMFWIYLGLLIVYMKQLRIKRMER